MAKINNVAKISSEIFGSKAIKIIPKNDVNIKIDGELVKAHDPLFLNVNKTQYPNDPVSEEYAPFEFQWPIRDEKIQKNWGEMGTVKIRMSLLPEKLRPYAGSGGSKEAKLRQIDDQQQGISILREDREVFGDRASCFLSFLLFLIDFHF